MSHSRFFDHVGPIAFAHRGGAAEAPENTWSAFERAVRLGYRYMETDARVTRDGVTVAFHDPRVDRVSWSKGRVASMTWASLSKLELREGSSVPRLEDLLATWPDVRWNIDVKERAAVAPVIAALRRTGSVDRALVASFSGRRSKALRAELGPAIALGAGRWAVASLVAAKFVRRVPTARGFAAAQVPPCRRGTRIVDSRFIRVCHERGLAVHVWTVNDAAEMAHWLDLGADGIMTDRPSLLRAVLVERAQW